MKVRGEVKKVFSRDVKGTKYYSVCVGGADEDGSDLWASCGRVRPDCDENDTVSFEAEKDGKYWKVDPANIKKEARGGPTKTSGGGGGWNDPNRQKSIVAQSSINMATNFITAALANDALSLGTAKAKPADKWEALNAVLQEKAREFYFIALDPDKFFGEAPEDEEEEEEEFNPVGE